MKDRQQITARALALAKSLDTPLARIDHIELSRHGQFLRVEAFDSEDNVLECKHVRVPPAALQAMFEDRERIRFRVIKDDGPRRRRDRKGRDRITLWAEGGGVL